MIHVTTVSEYMATNLSSQYGVVMTKVLLFHILLLENWEVKDLFVLLHRAALGRISVLAATPLAVAVVVRMPQTRPCCPQHPWEQDPSHKSLEHATAFALALAIALYRSPSYLLRGLLRSLQHPRWSQCARCRHKWEL